MNDSDDSSTNPLGDDVSTKDYVNKLFDSSSQEKPEAIVEEYDPEAKKLMQLIDAALLSPEHETELYQHKLYLGKKIGQYQLNKSFFLAILNYVLDEHGVDQTPGNTKILQKVVNKRRQYHQKSWRDENKPRPLKYGGDLGVMSVELRKLYKN